MKSESKNIQSYYDREAKEYRTKVVRSNFFKDYFIMQWKMKNYAYAWHVMGEYKEYFTKEEIQKTNIRCMIMFCRGLLTDKNLEKVGSGNYL